MKNDSNLTKSLSLVIAFIKGAAANKISNNHLNVFVCPFLSSKYLAEIVKRVILERMHSHTQTEAWVSNLHKNVIYTTLAFQ